MEAKEDQNVANRDFIKSCWIDEEEKDDYNLNDHEEQEYSLDRTKYDKIIVHENNEENNIRWDIWSDNFSSQKDLLVLWELWSTSVHQKWYGRDLQNEVPKEAWYWDRCKRLTEDKTIDPEDIRWFICSDLKGNLFSLTI